MEEELFDILNEAFKRTLIYCRPGSIREASEKVISEVKEFIKWKDDLKCPFSVHYNGEDPTKPKISYLKVDKQYTLEEVWQYWQKHRKQKF